MSDRAAARGLYVPGPAARPLPAAGGTVLAASSDTDGQFTLIRTTVPPGDATPLHRHLAMDESFYVLGGSYTVTCGADTFEVSTGDFVHLPRGIPHKYVAGPNGGEKLIVGTPGGLEVFFDDWESGVDAADLRRKHQIEFLE